MSHIAPLLCNKYIREIFTKFTKNRICGQIGLRAMAKISQNVRPNEYFDDFLGNVSLYYNKYGNCTKYAICNHASKHHKMRRKSGKHLSTASRQRICTKIVATFVVCAGFLAMCCCGCQLPYKIDPSGDCLFVRNEDANLPEFNSPFTSGRGTSSGATSTPPQTVPATIDPVYQSSVPGVTAMPGTASGIAPSSTGTGVVGATSPKSTSTLLVPGSGPIVLVTPDEQIALVGTEVILFANYKGDDDYLRIGERIEWSLGGVGHIQTTNKTQCGNMLALDFNKDKKLSDRFAVTSTLHYEGTIDRGSADEQGKIPHLAGQSWISIQSAEEGTSTVTAYAPTIKDWNRRTSSATVHWIDAEWIYPRPDVTKYDEEKIFLTRVKKRSSGSPCPNWIVRYEVTGGPNAGLGPNRSKTVEVHTDGNGDAAVDLHLLEGNSGTSTIKATIIRPAGVDGGTKRLELHSTTLTNYWSNTAPLSAKTILPNTMRWDERFEGAINVDNRSDVTKQGVVTLPLPAHVKFVSSSPAATSVTPQEDGGELVSWHAEFRPAQTAQIKFVVLPTTADPELKSKPIDLELVPKLSMFLASESGQTSPAGTGDTGYGGITPGTGSGTPPPTYAPDPMGTSGGGGTPWGSGGQAPGGYGGGGFGGFQSPGGTGTLPAATPGNCDPNTFGGKLQVECHAGAMIPVMKPYLVEVSVKNNASVPFYGGLVRIQLSERLGFLDPTGSNYVTDNGSYVTVQDYPISNISTGKDIAIAPGEAHTFAFYVAPYQAGQVNITATALGKTQNSETWTPISGAQSVKNIRAAEQN